MEQLDHANDKLLVGKKTLEFLLKEHKHNGLDSVDNNFNYSGEEDEAYVRGCKQQFADWANNELLPKWPKVVKLVSGSEEMSHPRFKQGILMLMNNGYGLYQTSKVSNIIRSPLVCYCTF